jgi:hypothetical protein
MIGCQRFYLIRLKAAVIVANTIAALAVKAQGTNIPVVFTTGSDPVAGSRGALDRVAQIAERNRVQAYLPLSLGR